MLFTTKFLVAINRNQFWLNYKKGLVILCLLKPYRTTNRIAWKPRGQVQS